MQLFRKLANNILFKIFLAFIALSFVLFGVSGFILNGPNGWVAKVGSKTISVSDFNQELQKTREMILSGNNSEEAAKYLSSDQFKSDILGRMVNAIIIEKLREDSGIQASEKLILEAIAKDKSFKSPDGKFDRKAFQSFLAKNGLDEAKYLSLIQTDVAATMMIQSLALVAPINDKEVIEQEQFKQEKRIADVIRISAKDAGKVATPTDAEIGQFFEANKKSYAAPEFRKVSFLRFSARDFAKDLEIKDEEIAAEYEKNKDKLQKPESRNLYHVLFDKEEDAKNFITKLDGGDKSKIDATFLKLAKELQNKDAKAVTLKNVTQKDLIAELANPIFKLNTKEHSEVLKSPLGFHVFLVNEIKKSEPITFAEAKAQIKADLLKNREEKVMQNKISEVDDAILATNSLSEVAQKFNISANLDNIEINAEGKKSNGELPFSIKDLDNFTQNAFALKKGESSKLFFAKSSNQYYAIKADEILVAHDRTLEEVKSQVTSDLVKSNQTKAVEKLAKSVIEELTANPQKLADVVKKYKLIVEKNKTLSRFSYINYQGHQIPYVDKFSSALFELNKEGEISTAVQVGNDEFAVGILRSVQKGTISENNLSKAKAEAAEAFRTDILQSYNAFVMKKYPVKVNDKIMGKKEQK